MLMELLIVGVHYAKTVIIVLEMMQCILIVLQHNVNLVSMYKLHVHVLQIKYVDHVLQELHFLLQVELQHVLLALLLHVQLALIKQIVQQHQTECAHLAQQAQVILYQVGLHSVCLAPVHVLLANVKLLAQQHQIECA